MVAGIAQLVEQLICNHQVPSSNLGAGTRQRGSNMKAGDAIILAAKKQAEGEMAVHQANIEVYKTMPAGIGEHSDIVEAVIAELDKMAAANDRLEMIEKHFSKE